MAKISTSPPLPAQCESGSGRGMSLLDRYLPVWIGAAMVAGIGLGRVAPSLGGELDRIRFADVSVPVGIGLIWMMYPVLARVRYGTMARASLQPKLMGTSLVLNWLVGPLMMMGLAWLLLPDLPEYRNGIILVGLARCIAMVLIWNMLARGDGELAALLVALNSLFQILFYSVLGYLMLTALPTWFGADATAVEVSMWLIARNVLLFLGVPLVMGAATRYGLVWLRGREWYETRFAPRFGRTALFGLLYTIVLLFTYQGDRIVESPLDVLRVAMPLGAYFVLMFATAFALSYRLRFTYEEAAAVSFTAAGNNFELAIAVAIGVFGIASGEAFATVVGPLIEVPVLVALVYLSLWLGARLFRRERAAPAQPLAERVAAPTPGRRTR